MELVETTVDGLEVELDVIEVDVEVVLELVLELDAIDVVLELEDAFGFIS